MKARHTNAVNGVNSDGFITIVHPTASAGATFQDLDHIMSEKAKGECDVNMCILTTY